MAFNLSHEKIVSKKKYIDIKDIKYSTITFEDNAK